MTIDKSKLINYGFIKVKPTFNNLFITLTDLNGNVLACKHAGYLNFKGSKKRTQYVAGLTMKELLLEIQRLELNIKLYIVQLKSFVKSSISYNIIKQFRDLNINNIMCVEYKNKKIHNGVRKPKKRRL